MDVFVSTHGHIEECKDAYEFLRMMPSVRLRPQNLVSEDYEIGRRF